MMEDDVITQRISAYSCCMGWAMYARMKALQDGDVKGAEVLLKKAMLLQWATRVLSGYTLSDGKCKGEIPSTDQEVECAMKHADPCCPVPCGCCDEEAEGGDPCAQRIDHTALSAVIASARQEIEFLNPAEGDAYLITGGEGDGLWTAGTIQTWGGAGTGWVATALSPGDVIDVSGTFWLAVTGGAVLMYPPYNMQLTGPNGTYQFTPVDPLITISLHRGVLIQTYNGTWLTVYATTEDALYAGLEVPFGMLPFSTARIVYLWGDTCRTPVEVGAILPEQLECGTMKELLVEVVPDATNGEFKLTVTIINGDGGYLMGNLDLLWDGTLESHVAEDGVWHYGPWPVGTQVQVVLRNKNSALCDIDAGTYTGTQCYVSSPVCLSVDASFMGSASPLTYYFISSDTTGAGNLWADYVGYIVIGGAFTLVPVGGEVQLGASPEARIIWTGSAMVPIAPQIHATYGDDTLYFVSQYPEVHGMRSRDVKVEAHSAANGWFTLYEGPEAALASVQSAPYNSVVSVVDQVRATYVWGGCSVAVVGDDIAPVFLCAGEGYGSFTVAPGETCYVYTESFTGYTALRSSDGTITVYGDYEIPSLESGSFCFFACDAEGQKTGGLKSLDISYASAVDVLGLTGILDVFITSCPLSSFSGYPDSVKRTALYSVPLSILPANPPAVEWVGYTGLDNATSLPVLPATAGYLSYSSLPNISVYPELPAAAYHVYYNDLALLSTLPDFDPSSTVDLAAVDCPALTAVGVLPQIKILTLQNTGFSTATVVDALINALDTPSAGTCAIGSTLLALRTSASDTNYNACISAGWTIT